MSKIILANEDVEKTNINPEDLTPVDMDAEKSGEDWSSTKNLNNVNNFRENYMTVPTNTSFGTFSPVLGETTLEDFDPILDEVPVVGEEREDLLDEVPVTTEMDDPLDDLVLDDALDDVLDGVPVEGCDDPLDNTLDMVPVTTEMDDPLDDPVLDGVPVEGCDDPMSDPVLDGVPVTTEMDDPLDDPVLDGVPVEGCDDPMSDPVLDGVPVVSSDSDNDDNDDDDDDKTDALMNAQNAVQEAQEAVQEVQSKLSRFMSVGETSPDLEKAQQSVEMAHDALLKTESRLKKAHTIHANVNMGNIHSVLSFLDEYMEDSHLAIAKLNRLSDTQGSSVIADLQSKISFREKGVESIHATMRRRVSAATKITAEDLEDMAGDLDALDIETLDAEVPALEKNSEGADPETVEVVTKACGALRNMKQNLTQAQATMRHMIRASDSEDVALDSVQEQLDTAEEKLEDAADSTQVLTEAASDEEVLDVLEEVQAGLRHSRSLVASCRELFGLGKKAQANQTCGSDDDCEEKDDMDMVGAKFQPVMASVPSVADQKDFQMILSSHDSENPVWNILVQGTALGRIELKDQPNPQEIGAYFVSATYEDAIRNSVARFGLDHTLKQANMRTYAAAVDRSALAKRIEAKLSAKNNAEMDRKTAQLVSQLVYAARVVNAGLNKNFWRGANRPLHHAIYEEATARGVYDPVRLVESAVAAGADAHFEEVMQRALAFMLEPKAVQQSIASAIDESLPQPPENIEEISTMEVGTPELPATMTDNQMQTQVAESRLGPNATLGQVLASNNMRFLPATDAHRGVGTRQAYKDQIRSQLGLDTRGRLLRFGN